MKFLPLVCISAISASSFVEYRNTQSGCIDGPGVDRSGDGCDWYYEHTSFCGTFKTATFNSVDTCCACGGGTCSDGSENCSLYCLDKSGVDSSGDGCDWYNERTSFCGSAFNTATFDSNDACCGCGGGWINSVSLDASNFGLNSDDKSF